MPEHRDQSNEDISEKPEEKTGSDDTSKADGMEEGLDQSSKEKVDAKTADEGEGGEEGMADVSQDQEELDYEPAKEDGKEDDTMNDEVEEVEEDLGYEIEGDLTRLRCIHCEFLKFKNIDEWKNHFIGHYRLNGMQAVKAQCFVKGCLHKQGEPNITQRLSNMGQHFIDVHKFKQAAYRKCDICSLEFYEERKYNTHMKKHDPSFTCDLCKKKITGKLWFRKHIEKCYGDERPSWARAPVEVQPGEDKEVLEIYGKEYDVRWGTVTNTFTKKTRICARAWIEGKGWVGRGETRDEARNMLIKALKNHIKKTMDKGLYTLEDGEIVPEPTLSETPAPPSNSKKSCCPQCGTQFSKRANLELHMFMHRNEGKSK